VKITLDREPFADAVTWAAKSLPNRPSVPVLAGMRLTAADGLTFSSFDYDTSSLVTVSADIGEPGDILVSGKMLAQIAASLPPKPVSIEDDGQRVTIRCGSFTSTLLTMPVQDYPALPAMPEPAGTLGSDLWATAVAQSVAAAGRDDTLPALTGVRIEIEGDTLTLISTDRYRLAVRVLKWTPARPDLSTAVLVPARTLDGTAKALTAGDVVSIALALPGERGSSGGEGMIGFEGAGRQTTTRLLGGEFPRYEALLPKVVNGIAELAAGPFAEAVKRVALVAERNTAVRLSFSAGQLVLDAGTGDEATATEVLEAGYEGDDIQIAFNPQYLLDGLTAIGSDVARIAFTEPGKPALITGAVEGDGVPDYRYLLMPIRLGG
jgi:DNA polymerase III subunit beta